MISQSSHVIVDCPICGRPLEIQPQLLNHKIACGHCCGEFIAYEADDGSLTTLNLRGTDLLKRAEQLLRATCDSGLSASEKRCQPRFSSASELDGETRLDDPVRTLPEDAECEGEPKPTVLLIEHRDEVFARLATDMAEFGMRVIRAKSAAEAMELYNTYEPTLLVGNIDLPDQSGWQMTAKLQQFGRRVRVWLYQHQPSSYGHKIANFLGVEAPLAYRGDLLGLSEIIVNRMDDGYEACDAARHAEGTKLAFGNPVFPPKEKLTGREE
ncbi:MAG: response regulator [Planctomycetes bacterium]|nr:response regulator [Planctomycetota bacterium]